MKVLGPCPAGRRGVAELICRKGAYRNTGKKKVKVDGTAGMRTQCVIFLAHTLSAASGGWVLARSLHCPFDRHYRLAGHIAFAAPQLPFKVEYVRVGRQPQPYQEPACRQVVHSILTKSSG